MFLQLFISPDVSEILQHEFFKKPVASAFPDKHTDEIVNLILNAKSLKQVTDYFIEYPHRHSLAIDAVSTKNFMSPLTAAAENGIISILKWVLEKGANIDLKDSKQETALFIATRNANLQIVQFLLRRGANVKIKNQDSQFTPLHQSVLLGNYEIAIELINYKAIIDSKNSEQSTPLTVACGVNNTRMALLLLSYYADGFSENLFLLRPIDLAVKNGMAGVVEEMLDFHHDVIDLDKPNGRGLTLMFFAW